MFSEWMAGAAAVLANAVCEHCLPGAEGEHRVTLKWQLSVCGTHTRQGDNLGAASRLTNPSFCALLTFPVQLHFP